MIKITKQEKPTYDNSNTPRITEDRELVAEVVKVEEHISKDHPEWTPALRVIFRVLEEPYVGAFASGLAPAIWQPDTKLDRWLTALGIPSTAMGTTITDGELSSKLRKQQARIIVRVKNGFANVVDVQAMSERDQKRISPDAFKKQARPNIATSTAPNSVSTATQPAQNLTTSQPVTPAVPAPSPTNVTPQGQGQVTHDDSLPF